MAIRPCYPYHRFKKKTTGITEYIEEGAGRKAVLFLRVLCPLWLKFFILSHSARIPGSLRSYYDSETEEPQEYPANIRFRH
jgi:hypothetical protein